MDRLNEATDAVIAVKKAVESLDKMFTEANLKHFEYQNREKILNKTVTIDDIDRSLDSFSLDNFICGDTINQAELILKLSDSANDLIECVLNDPEIEPIVRKEADLLKKKMEDITLNMGK